ncbi:MAG: hypothetical protein AB1758_32800, partial [Candidatus Eremiobacterota bacterium]
MDRFLDAVGLGLGEFSLDLERSEVTAGEPIRGVFRFRLKQLVKANRVVVGLKAWRTETTRSRRSDGEPEKDTDVQVLHDFEKQLDGARNYDEATYHFELRTPTEVFQSGLMEGVGKL